MDIINPNPPKPRPPYLIGLLCLIPLLGALAGIVLLLLGIFKYKDKWMIMIGAFGIVFTVAIYSSLFYYAFKSDAFSKGFAELSQMQLNSLVKNVEFYKIQHGHYPDKLEQVLADDKMAPVNDPIQLSKMRTISLYNYERSGDQYALFSSGLDGKPYTKDDLFPEMVIGDSSKVGLIKPRQ